MRILFVCNLVDSKLNKAPKGFQAAALSWQAKLLAGFEQIDGVTVDLLSVPLLPSFSLKFPILFIKGKKWTHKQGSDDRSVSFLNIFPIRNVIRKLNVSKYTKKWIKQHKGENICIITYSPSIPLINAACIAKKHNVNNCAIIPDLPEYVGFSKMKDPIYRFLKQYDIKLFYKKANKIDNFILFSEHMVEKFQKKINYSVVECICDDINDDQKIEKVDNKIRLVYTGGLEKEYGIELLIEAFAKIKDNKYLLEICGTGGYEKKVKEAAIANPRIKFYGLVSQAEAVNIQNRAALLINPRMPDNIFTKYSFPSKIAEYMMTGKPVLCFKLLGIPDEFDKYLFYFENSDPTNMAKRIEEIVEFEYEKNMKVGIAGREFLSNNKNSKKQAEAVLSQAMRNNFDYRQ